MSSAAGVVLAIVVAVLSGMVVGLLTGILAWIRDSNLPVSERAAGAILRAGAAFGATVLLALAIFATVGILH